MAQLNPCFSVDALLEEEQPFDSADPKRGGWAHLEIMGHREYYGFVREVNVFGVTMCEVLVPFEDKPGVQIRKAFGGSAIFSCSPTTREECKRWAPRGYSGPARPQLTSGSVDDDIEDGDFEPGDGEEADCLRQRDHEQSPDRGEGPEPVDGTEGHHAR